MTALNTDLLKKYKSLFSTTLSTGIGTGTSDTITPSTVSGLPTTTAITLTFDRVDSGGTATPTTLERITGVISGGNFTSYVRAKDNTTEQAHTGGAVIEMVWNAQDWNDMIDWGLTEHKQDGTHSDITASSITLGATAQVVSILDEDTMSSNSATALSTQQSTKAYVDASSDLTAAPASDHSVNGITITLTAGANLAFGDVGYIALTGKVALIDADAITSMSAVVMCADASILADASGSFLVFGIARDDTWAWTVGGLIYGTVTGTTGNTLSQTAPIGTDDVVQIIGVATHANRMLFRPSLIQTELV